MSDDNDAQRIASHESTIKFAEIAIQSLLFLSGGAAVALLTFAGDQKTGLEQYAWAVSLFGWAAAGAVLTAGLSYLSQALFCAAIDYKSVRLYWIGEAFRALGVILWFASLGTFLCGVGSAADAVRARPDCPIATSKPQN